MKSEADAGDVAAGDLVGVEEMAVFVGKVKGTVSLGGLLKPVDKDFHRGVDDLLCASEADENDYDSHVGDSEISVRAFP